MLVNTTSSQQEEITNWFSNNNVDREISIYFYNNDRNIQWLVTAFNVSKYRYVNLNNTKDQSGVVSSYLLSLDNCYYSLDDPNEYEIFRLLNTSRVDSILEFLEKVIPVVKVETPEL
jgi:hypothetical protein